MLLCGRWKTILKKLKDISSVQLIVVSFLLIVLLGAALLCIPSFTKFEGSVKFVDALFTATSATCVTGLSVFDTFTGWTIPGQLVILFLIQLGGLGMVTFTTATTLFLRKKLDLKELQLAKEHTNGEVINIASLVKTILICTFLFEALGAMVLCIRFVPQFGAKGIFSAVFMAISSYCNAGFDILGFLSPNEGSLTFYKTDALVSLTIAFLTIFGGLGFIVMRDIWSFLVKRVKNKDSSARLSVHTIIVLAVTVLLLFSGTVFFMALEYGGTLAELSFKEKLLASFFYSSSIRTAGFFSVPIASQRVITKIITIFFMFIGASSSSTGGGIKTTTLAILLMTCVCVLRGKEDPTIFKHRISKFTVYKAITILMLFLIFFLLFSFLISIMEGAVPFLDIAYEVVSALSTTGLSTGITAGLKSVSKLLICLAIFTGRVGPISLILAITIKKHKRGVYKILPDSKIIVG